MFITLQPTLLSWARQRAGLQEDVLAKKMGVKLESVQAWEASGRLRMSQVEKLAHVTLSNFNPLQQGRICKVR
jgi:DNA-binding transcriptional regulator YiaG